MRRALLLSLISSTTLLTAAPQPQTVHRPLAFEPNRGQFPAQVEWIARGAGYQLALTSEGATVMVREGAPERPKHELMPDLLHAPTAMPAAAKPKYSTVRMKLTGSRPWKEVTGLETTGAVSNYFFGNDPKAWRTNVPQYARISAAGVYDGIDLVFYSHEGNLEYDFVVKPGADPKQIHLAFEGQEGMRVDDKSGDLVLTTAGGSEIRQIRPKVYQQVGDQRVEVAGGYELLDRGRAAFTLASYDRRQALVIDPTLIFQRAWLGNDRDDASAIAVDASGNAYVTGLTDSFNFLNSCYPGSACGAPANPALLPDQAGTDAFVLAVSPQGNPLFVTYLGGQGSDAAYGIAVDSTGVYVTGTTSSTDFPHQSFKKTVDADVFVTKMNLNGGLIFYTAIVGGSMSDIGLSVAVDPATHFAYVTGVTHSSNFPNNYHITGSGPDAYDGGYGDAFIFYLDNSGNLGRSVRIPGNGFDYGGSIALDPNGNAWITGETCSSDFTALAPNPYKYRGACSGFVVKWRPLVSTPQFAYYLNGGKVVTVDAAGNGYVLGEDFIAYKGTIMYFTKFDPSGAVLLTRTVTGGGFIAENVKGNGIALNAAGEVYITGYADDTLSHHSGVFVAKLKFDSSGDFQFLTEPGGTGENAVGIAVHDSSPFVLPQIYIASTSNGSAESPAPLSAEDALVYRLDDDWPGLGLKRLRNFSVQNEYINIESGAATVGPIEPGWLSAQWQIIARPTIAGDPSGQTVYWIQNRWKPDEFLNIESGSIQSTPIEPGWLSARWTFELISGTSVYQIHNVWQRDKYLNIANGILTAGPRVTIPPLPTHTPGAGEGRPSWYWILDAVN